MFLDIEMEGENGFELFDRISHIDFDVIFTSEVDDFALKAIKCSALDYLVKPFNPEEIDRAIDKAVREGLNSIICRFN